jgi:hypothetical protein
MSEKQNKSIDELDSEDRFIKRLVISVVIISAVLIGILAIGYYKTGHFDGNDIDHNYLSAFGDFIGGLIGVFLGLVTIYLVYRTYVTQKKELRQQQEELRLTRGTQEKQNFENTFFSLINNVKNKIQNLELENPPKKGNDLIYYFKYQFRNYYNQQSRTSLNSDSEKRTSPDEFITDNETQTQRILGLYKHFILTQKGIILKEVIDEFFLILEFMFQSELRRISEQKKDLDTSDIKNQYQFYGQLLKSQFNNDFIFHIYYHGVLSKRKKELIEHYKMVDGLFIDDLVDTVEHRYLFKEIVLKHKSSLFL